MQNIRKRVYIFLLIIVTIYMGITTYMIYGIKIYRISTMVGMVLSYSWQISLIIWIILVFPLLIKGLFWARKKKKDKSMKETIEEIVEETTDKKLKETTVENIVEIIENNTELGDSVEC